VGSDLGIGDEKLDALAEYHDSDLFTAREKLVLRYADAMTITGGDVTDELFAALRAQFSEEEIIVLTEVIAWENASSKFNRALRVPSQGLWHRKRVAGDLPT
jgi:alkylhydroperoxidase family enzyme